MDGLDLMRKRQHVVVLLVVLFTTKPKPSRAFVVTHQRLVSDENKSILRRKGLPNIILPRGTVTIRTPLLFSQNNTNNYRTFCLSRNFRNHHHSKLSTITSTSLLSMIRFGPRTKKARLYCGMNAVQHQDEKVVDIKTCIASKAKLKLGTTDVIKQIVHDTAAFLVQQQQQQPSNNITSSNNPNGNDTYQQLLDLYYISILQQCNAIFHQFCLEESIQTTTTTKDESLEKFNGEKTANEQQHQQDGDLTNVSILSLCHTKLPASWGSSPENNGKNHLNKKLTELELDLLVENIIRFSDMVKVLAGYSNTNSNNITKKPTLTTRIKIQQLAKQLLRLESTSLDAVRSTATTTTTIDTHNNNSSSNKKNTYILRVSNVLCFLSVIASLAVQVEEKQQYKQHNSNNNSGDNTNDDNNNNNNKNDIMIAQCRSVASAMTSVLETVWWNDTTTTNFLCDVVVNNGADDNHRNKILDQIDHEFGRVLSNSIISALLGCNSVAHGRQILQQQQQQQQRSIGEQLDDVGATITMSVDMHIVTSLAKSLQLNYCTATESTIEAVAHVIQDRFAVGTIGQQKEEQQEEEFIETESSSVPASPFFANGKDLQSTLALASQFCPWQTISPLALLDIAIQNNLWHAAETMVTSTVALYNNNSNSDDTNNSNFKSKNKLCCNQMVVALIDGAINCRLYRLADTFASKFFLEDPLCCFPNNHNNTTNATSSSSHTTITVQVPIIASRFLKARYLHACNTIVKVIRKRAISVIERQIVRIDDSVAHVEKIVVQQHQQSIQYGSDGDTIQNDNDTNDYYYNSYNDDDDINMLVIVPSDGTSHTTSNHNIYRTVRQYSTDIRTFALQQLQEYGDIDTAQRLARIWIEMNTSNNHSFTYNETTLQEALERRKATYLQWEDVFPTTTSQSLKLISTPQDLYDAFVQIGFYTSSSSSLNSNEDDTSNVVQQLTSSLRPPPSLVLSPNQDHIYGIDVEWGGSNDDNTNNKVGGGVSNVGGADLLQISTLTMALLIDIPALCQSIDGIVALKQTVGYMFTCPKCIVVGFSCKQDISRLRTSSRTAAKIHQNDDRKQQQNIHSDDHDNDHNDYEWLVGSTVSVHDVQLDICYDQPTLKTYGLSKCCDYYIGKPLDKSEQCSLWDQRPLTKEQMIYAALDAYVCVCIYHKLQKQPK